MKPKQVVFLKLPDGSHSARMVIEVKEHVVSLCTLSEYERSIREGRLPQPFDFPTEFVSVDSKDQDSQ